MEKEKHNGNNEGKSPGGCKPIGPLADVLDYFETPDGDRVRIARRVGPWVGTSYLPIETIEDVIKKSMMNGLPDWLIVTEELVDIVRYTRQRNRL